MRNKIVYDNRTFTTQEIKSGSVKIHMATSLLSTTLEANTFTADVKSEDPTITNFVRNTPLVYYHRDIQRFIAYVQSISKISHNRYRLYGTSAIGLLMDRMHAGGIYNGETVQEVVAEICGSIPVIIKDNLKNIALYGWLPYVKPPKNSARDNLRQVLFAIGATIKNDLDGVLRIEALWDGASGSVERNKTYQGASVKYGSAVSGVVVTEHQYIAGTEDKDLFEGTTQSGDVITFSEPMHSLTASGFSILESGSNYAVVSAGTGTLSGKRYIHNTRQISRNVSSTRSSGTENVKSVTDATLVSLVNSVSVAERLANYYACQETIDGNIVLERQSTGDVVNAYHPYDRKMVQACIESLDITASGIMKAKAKQLVGYTPLQFEQIVTYDEHELLTGNGSWIVPDGVTEIRVVLIAGGQAGYNGEAGEDCPAGGSFVYRDDDDQEATVQAGQTGSISSNATRSADGDSAGQGGAGGSPGTAGNVFQTTVEVTPGMSIAYSCGVGGASNGAAGGQTVFGELTSADGGVPPDGYTDVVTGITYAKGGISGGNGGRGGGINAAGESVNGVSGGQGYSPNDDSYSRDYTSKWPEYGGTVSYSDGGAGGGAAGGSSGTTKGSPGGDAAMGSWDYTIGQFVATSRLGESSSGDGGRGANGAPGDTYGSAGSGGAGGGGAGAIGNGSVSAQHTYRNRNTGTSSITIGSRSEVSIYPRSGGNGGAGGSGGAGAAGCIIIYYGVAKEVKSGAIIGAEGKIRLDKYGRLMVG